MLEGEEGTKFLVEPYLPEQAWKDQNLKDKFVLLPNNTASPAGGTPLLVSTPPLVRVAEGLWNTVLVPESLALPLAPGCHQSVT